MGSFLVEQPAPQVPVWRLLTVDLEIQPSCREVGLLLRIEFEGAGDRAGCRMRDREIEYLRTAHTSHGTLVDAGDRGGRPQAFECARDRQRMARQCPGNSTASGNGRLHGDVNRDR